ncbi:hypothetical protein Glove_680g66 [Diversispora epigaea]|uniref:Protein kinase domain-containing protein n=1 Tax=Diversispora epigaea TaxID=1348612 RepID=A0A397G8X4_9GLOM|nr:hypothetical protein Glove_680g66 [Diversispora epigaea]
MNFIKPFPIPLNYFFGKTSQINQMEQQKTLQNSKRLKTENSQNIQNTGYDEKDFEPILPNDSVNNKRKLTQIIQINDRNLFTPIDQSVLFDKSKFYTGNFITSKESDKNQINQMEQQKTLQNSKRLKTENSQNIQNTGYDEKDFEPILPNDSVNNKRKLTQIIQINDRNLFTPIDQSVLFDKSKFYTGNFITSKESDKKLPQKRNSHYQSDIFHVLNNVKEDTNQSIITSNQSNFIHFIRTNNREIIPCSYQQPNIVFTIRSELDHKSQPNRRQSNIILTANSEYILEIKSCLYQQSTIHSELNSLNSISQISQEGMIPYNILPNPNYINYITPPNRTQVLDIFSAGFRRLSLPNNKFQDFITNYAHILDQSYFKYIGRKSKKFNPTESSNYSDYFTNKFIIEKVIGSGEFSIAFRVKDKKTNTLYAVKKRKIPFGSHTERCENLEEVEIMWKLGNHPNCIQLFAAWEQQGYLYLQTELCENGTLETFFKKNNKLNDYQIWKIFTNIAFGLEHIHNCNVMHLDLKPGNIFQSSNGSFKIGDFGLSARWPPHPDLDKEGDCRYISFEALNNKYDKSTDIYSLGMILIEMIENISMSNKLANKIRLGNLSKLKFEGMTDEIILLAKSMVQVNHKARPTIQQILELLRNFCIFNELKTRFEYLQ